MTKLVVSLLISF